MTTPASSSPISSVSPYAFPERALRRWATENLRLTPRADGGIDAVFRFEGSTCGNVSFLLNYRISLGAGSAGERRIDAMDCAPADFDDGHARMCCWQENAEAAAALIRAEQPLRGESLAAVLSWRPRKSPAGCLCAEPSRNHKWQAVLETLHFVLRAEKAPAVETPSTL